MAYLDDKNQQAQSTDGNAATGQPGQGQPQAQQTAQGAAPTVSGSGGSDVGGGVSTAGVGAGGAGGWTNIQAYLNANQGDNGSAKNLSDSTSKQFGQEQSQMQGQSQKALGDAQGYVDKTNITNDKADALIKDAANNYGWDGTQNDAYKADVATAQAGMNAQYGAPTSFSYNLGANTQNYGNALGNDGAFSNLMTKLYSDKAGSPLTSGQQSLQNQFDSNNSNLSQARQDALNQYGNLNQARDKTNVDTSNALQGDVNQFHQNQNNFKGYLGNQSTAYGGKVTDAQQSANDAYNNTLQTGLSGDAAGGYNPGDAAGAKLGAAGIWSPNMTWAQLAKEHGFVQNGGGPFASLGGTGMLYGANDAYGHNAADLSNFYGEQKNQYANAGDPEKQGFNSIQDFLGTSVPKQTQGYDVTGGLAPVTMSTRRIGGRTI